VHSFIISIHELLPGILEQTTRVASELDANIQLVEVSCRQKETSIEANNKEEIREKYVAPNDWIIPADLDEFIHFPAPVPELISEMEAVKATHIMGHFSDRISADGHLTPTTETPSIWEQYPLQCNVSKSLVKCWTHKVVLARGDCVLASGHHDVISPKKRLETRSAKVHHFKWRAGLPEALARRIKIYKRQNFPCIAESTRILNYLEKHKRIVPSDFRARRGWKPGDIQKKSEAVVYTAISTGYDSLKPLPPTLVADKSVAFVGDGPRVQGWQLEPLHDAFDDPCRNAKIHKILPHRYFPDADYSLWIDGSVAIGYKGTMGSLIELLLGDDDLAVFKHRTRRCIFEEALACIRLRKDDPDLIFQQMSRYSREGYPRHAGLAECCVLLRRHTPEMNAFNEAWWEEICKGSKRDQLSFNYVARKMNFPFNWIPKTIARNEFFIRNSHEQTSLRSGSNKSIVPA
jgi:hypothetical protein